MVDFTLHRYKRNIPKLSNFQEKFLNSASFSEFGCEFRHLASLCIMGIDKHHNINPYTTRLLQTAVFISPLYLRPPI